MRREKHAALAELRRRLAQGEPNLVRDGPLLDYATFLWNALEDLQKGKDDDGPMPPPRRGAALSLSQTQEIRQAAAVLQEKVRRARERRGKVVVLPSPDSDPNSGPAPRV